MTDILVDDINCYEVMTVLSGNATVIMTEDRGGRTSAFDCHWESTGSCVGIETKWLVVSAIMRLHQKSLLIVS